MTDRAENDRDTLRNWIKQNLVDKGVSPTKAAKDNGFATTTLTKFLNDPDYTFTPSTPVVLQLERYFGRRAPGASAREGERAVELEAVQVDAADLAKPLQDALAALTDARAHIELWKVSSTALIAAGIAPGDLVMIDMDEPPRAGDIVCAEIHDRGSKRTVFRIYEKPYLVAATYEATHRAPIVVDDRNVIVRGVVTDRLSRRRI